MGLNLEYTDGQTPLDEEEKEGLLIPTVSNKGELDEFEQQNIEEAIQWLMIRSLKAEVVFTERFVKELHKRMYSQVWRWAGQYRKSEKNLGVKWWEIPTHVKILLQDALFWHQNEIYTPDEIAIRFKHRVVSIHCFSNGNGRHSRLMADIIAEKIFHRPVFSWGAANLTKASEARTLYLKAVKEADKGCFHSLIEFARS